MGLLDITHRGSAVPKSEMPFIPSKAIDLALNRLLNSKMHLGSSLAKTTQKKSGNGIDQVLDIHAIESILGEDSAAKKQMDTERVFQLALLKEVELVIDELLSQFYLGQEREKEVMLLTERLKEIEKNHKDIEAFEDSINHLNRLESLEKERVKALILLEIMQRLDEDSLYLEIEKMEIYEEAKQKWEEAFNEVEMLQENGKPLNQVDKAKLSHNWTVEMMQFMEKYVDEEETELENKNFNRLYHYHKKNHHPQETAKKSIENSMFFSKYNHPPALRRQATQHNLFHTEKFEQKFSDLVANFFRKNQIIVDSDQANKIAQEHISSMHNNDFFKNCANIFKQARNIKNTKSDIHQAHPELNPVDTTSNRLREERAEKMKNRTRWKPSDSPNPLREKRGQKKIIPWKQGDTGQNIASNLADIETGYKPKPL